MPANISLKPRPTSPWPICLAPRSTRLVAWSTLVLSAAPAVPQERATAARNPGAIHVQRRVRVITHLHHTTGGSRSRLARIWATLRQGAYHVPTRWEILGSARAVYLGKKKQENPQCSCAASNSSTVCATLARPSELDSPVAMTRHLTYLFDVVGHTSSEADTRFRGSFGRRRYTPRKRCWMSGSARSSSGVPSNWMRP